MRVCWECCLHIFWISAAVCGAAYCCIWGPTSGHCYRRISMHGSLIRIRDMFWHCCLFCWLSWFSGIRILPEECREEEDGCCNRPDQTENKKIKQKTAIEISGTIHRRFLLQFFILESELFRKILDLKYCIERKNMII